ncbi:MAG TPA: HEAT repeat domain-containing protein, partial [Dissulfurispiraceae bacterium]|nr:HEAT repeat domain-containing protein [Dissulfurispiraceae bacterium]
MIRSLKRILLKLQSEDPSVRRLAAERLSEADERAIYPLIQALKDRHPGVQDAAMRSLVAIGGEVTAYMTLPLLREEPSVRNMAVVILGELGVHAVPLVYPLLGDKNGVIRKFAVDLLRKIGSGVDPSR